MTNLNLRNLRLTDYWVDGHYIIASSPEAAKAAVKSIYNYDAELVRLWTSEDQEHLDWQTEEAY